MVRMLRLRWARWGLALTAVLTGLLGAPRPAAAHPLGNFTVNHYSRIEIYGDRLRVRYVLDMAEIPAFQALSAMDRNADGRTDDAEVERYRTQTMRRLLSGLTLKADDQPLALKVVDAQLTFPPGQSDLKTLRLSLWLEAPLQAGAPALAVSYRDDNDLERLGWNEIVVQVGPGIQLEASSAPAHDTSQELRVYPNDMLSNPLNQRTADFRFAVLTRVSAAPLAPGVGEAGPGQDELTRLVGVENLNPAVAALALAVAALYGTLHAFTPGHGKALVGAYLVGSRGTPRHALLLGLTVTATHTLGVYALGLVTLFAEQYLLPETLFPILGLVSGLTVVVIGGSLFVGRLRTVPSGHVHPLAQSTDEHPHTHGHTHFAAHAHGHLPSNGQAVTLRSLLALGISGGLIPCPTALLIMLGAIALNRVAFGMVLIIAFSAGLALVLTAVGLALVYAGRLFERVPHNDRAVRLISAASALLMAVVGMGATLAALRQLLA
jgi:nickel/cobalt transporter (NicO) family protein